MKEVLRAGDDVGGGGGSGSGGGARNGFGAYGPVEINVAVIVTPVSIINH